MHFGIPVKHLLRLELAVETLGIPAEYKFHNAFNDAYYTAEILKKIYNPFIQPKIYDPSTTTVRPRQPKREIDIDGLIKQFEKMYAREMTDEEKDIILLADEMGKTRQFLK